MAPEMVIEELERIEIVLVEFGSEIPGQFLDEFRRSLDRSSKNRRIFTMADIIRLMMIIWNVRDAQLRSLTDFVRVRCLFHIYHVFLLGYFHFCLFLT